MMGPRRHIHDALRDGTYKAPVREVSPSEAIPDAQSVKTVEQPATYRGYDGGKRGKGRKRHFPLNDGDFFVGQVIELVDVVVDQRAVAAMSRETHLVKRGRYRLLCCFGFVSLL
jgi:hypothetical protein